MSKFVAFIVIVVLALLHPFAHAQTPAGEGLQSLPRSRHEKLPATAEVQAIANEGALILPNEHKVYLIGVHALIAPSAGATRAKLRAFLEKEVRGKRVRFEYDKQVFNVYGHALAYVFTQEGNLFVNKEIVRRGLAKALVVPPNLSYAAQLHNAELIARTAQVGMWQDRLVEGQVIKLRFRHGQVSQNIEQLPGIKMEDGSVMPLWPQHQSGDATDVVRDINEDAFMRDWQNWIGKIVRVNGRVRRGPIPMAPKPPYLVFSRIEAVTGNP